MSQLKKKKFEHLETRVLAESEPERQKNFDKNLLSDLDKPALSPMNF